MIAHFYYRPQDIPPIVLGIIYGGAAILMLMLLLPRTIPAIFTIGTAVALSYAVMNLSPAKLATAFGAIIVYTAIARRLEVGVICVLVVCASMFYESVIPKPITFGGMGFNVSEGIIVFMLAITIFEVGSRRELPKFVSPTGAWLLLFVASAIMSMIVAYAKYKSSPGGTWDFAQCYNSIRLMFVYMLFFVIQAGVKNRKQLRTIIIAALLVATVVSMLMAVQYFLGTRVKVFFGTPYGGPRVENLSAEDQGVTRSLPPGLAIIAVVLPIAAYLTACAKDKKKRRILGFITLSLVIGLVFSFTRSLWSSMFIGLMIMWFISNKGTRKGLIRTTVIIPIIALLVSLAVGTMAPGAGGVKFRQALSERFLSTFQKDTIQSSSLQNRFYENRAAIKRIKENPIFGIGAGNPIRYGVAKTITKEQVLVPVTNMHNSYLEIWLILGLPGIIAFAGLSITFLIRCFLLFKTAKDPFFKAIAAGSLAGYIGFLIRSAVTMTILHELSSIISIVLLMGVTEAARRLNKESLSNQPLNEPGKHARMAQRLEESIV